MKRLIAFVFLLYVNIWNGFSQTQDFYFGTIDAGPFMRLEEVVIPSFPAFHSSAVGSFDGKWFILGGRTNGLHGFYPPFAFPNNGVQNQIYVVDPEAGSVWSIGMDSLPQPLKEQLSSSNMQQCVVGDKMYISGGYGYSQTEDDFITFPYLTQVDLPALSQAVISGNALASCFRYVVDSAMAVTGGRLLSHNNRLYQFFGHKFTGRYSITPGDLFEQEYTYQIRMFDVVYTADSIQITNYNAITDSINFRRRDLNVTHSISDGIADGFMAWSGVFRADADRPFTSQIFIHHDGTYEIIQEEQKYNQYHCAHIPFGLPNTNSSVIFIGGMAEVDAHTDSRDTLVPFVKNVTLVERNSLDIEERGDGNPLSTFMGTNAEFMPNPTFFNEQLGIVVLPGGDCPVIEAGYIIGGIESTGVNISSSNDPSLSFASAKIYKVILGMQCGKINEYNTSAIQVFPNPSRDNIFVKTEEPITQWQVLDITGKVVLHQKSSGTSALDVSELKTGTYFVKIFTEQQLYRSTFIKL